MFYTAIRVHEDALHCLPIGRLSPTSPDALKHGRCLFASRHAGEGWEQARIDESSSPYEVACSDALVRDQSVESGGYPLPISTRKRMTTPTAVDTWGRPATGHRFASVACLFIMMEPLPDACTRVGSDERTRMKGPVLPPVAAATISTTFPGHALLPSNRRRQLLSCSCCRPLRPNARLRSSGWLRLVAAANRMMKSRQAPLPKGTWDTSAGSASHVSPC